MNKKIIRIGAIAVIVVVVGGIAISAISTHQSTALKATTTTRSTSKNNNHAPHSMKTTPNDVLVYDAKTGMVSLYDETSGKKLDNVLIADSKANRSYTKTIKTTVMVSEKTNSSLYHGFGKKVITIQPGQNVWTIQSQLTPAHPIATMLGLLEQVNHQSNLNLVYPHQSLTFLVSPSTPIMVAKEKTRTVIVKEASPSVIYGKDTQTGDIYFYDNHTRQLSEISVINNKITIQAMHTIPIHEPILALSVNDGNVYLLTKQHQMDVASLQTAKLMASISLPPSITTWAVDQNRIFYANQSQLVAVTLNTKKKTPMSVNAGAKILSMENSPNGLLVLTDFGKGLNHNLLEAFNPITLAVTHVDTLYSAKNVLLPASKNNTVYIVEKNVFTSSSTAGNGNTVLLPINTKKWENGMMLNGVTIGSSPTMINGNYLSNNNGTINVFSIVNEGLQSSWKVDPSSKII